MVNEPSSQNDQCGTLVDGLNGLREKLLAEFARSESAILIVDLRDMTSFGVGLINVLLSVGQRIRDPGGVLALCGLQPIHMEALGVVQVDKAPPIPARCPRSGWHFVSTVGKGR